jgi:YidC/Oxa1 family membrane protein insertase
MERRVLVAIFLSFIVIYAWQALVYKPAPKPAGAGSSPAQAGRGAPAGGSPAAASPAAQQPAAPEQPPVLPPTATVVGDTVVRDVRIETHDVIAVFTNEGGRLKSWRLKGYQDAQHQPLELVAQNLPPNQPLPFSLRVPDAAMTARLNSALYTVSGAPEGDGELASPVDLKFEYQDVSGIRVAREFHLEPTSFVLAYRQSVQVGGAAVTPVLEWGPALGDTETVTRFAVPPGGLLMTADDEQRLTASALTKQATYEGTYKLAGVEDHYFLTGALDPGPIKVTYAPLTLPAPAGSSGPARTLVGYSLEPKPGQGAAWRFYVGPKDFDQLALVDRDLVRSINFGVFTIIVVPLLRSLKWLNGYIGNYGWSIIALTAIINLIIFPLRHKSLVSMRKMQEIQPEAKAIQDRYAKLKATDPAKQKMNQELMALYRERGVNPAAGCVPMLLPFPILIAFYSLLSTAIELRGAPFTLWIHDLAAPDPYYVTPILMGVSQLWQQWMAPAAGVDPIQRRMMMIMPVVFTFLFIGYPAGVALYWLASNVWAIGQQYATNYMIGPPHVRTVRSPAERRMKRVGSSKTDAAARGES